MNRKGSLLFFIVFSLLISLIVINIDFNATSDNNVVEEETIYTSKEELVYNSEDQISIVLKQTNEYRKLENKKALVLDENLSKVANDRAKEISTQFSHEREDGTYFFKLLDKYNIKVNVSGENIAKGYNDGYEVCEGFKASKGHYANMVKDRYTKIGIGMYESNGIIYWVQIFSD